MCKLTHSKSYVREGLITILSSNYYNIFLSYQNYLLIDKINTYLLYIFVDIDTIIRNILNRLLDWHVNNVKGKQ